MTIYGLSEKEYKDYNEWFQRVKKNIAEDEKAKSLQLKDMAQLVATINEKNTFAHDLEAFLQQDKLKNDKSLSEISSDTIINDTNKEIAITDTTNETSVVAESVSDKEEEIILESSAISNEPEVVVEIADLAAELLSDSNETPPTISPSFDNSISETIDPAEDATNLDVVSSRVNLDDFYSSISNTNHAICTVKATNTKSPFTSFVHTVTSKFSSLWHSFTNSIHSKNESTGDTVLDVNSSSDSSFADNHDVKEDGVHCTGEGALDTGILSIL